MRYIKKQDHEPDCLTKFKQEFLEWKRKDDPQWEFSKLDWDDFKNPHKAELLNVLLKEQGYICCYCGRRISSSHNSHIEHLKPKSKSRSPSYADLVVTYTNLLASCNGYTEEQESEYEEKLKQKRHTPKPAQEFCGAKKGEWYDDTLTVSPLIENCAEYFTYTAAGEILPANIDEKAAHETIIRLGLNNEKLIRRRENVIKDTLKLIRTQQFSSQQLQKLIQGYDKLDNRGEYGEHPAF
ncbi:retron system putative HNH endonuclease [Microcoleus sp. B3-A4]|uniref:retron system putative HNH endonuclease n=1 Tax=Microcoleus sp. B3-A4 TaxID=2818653 RepID=UPI002FD380D7